MNYLLNVLPDSEEERFLIHNMVTICNDRPKCRIGSICGNKYNIYIFSESDYKKFLNLGLIEELNRLHDKEESRVKNFILDNVDYIAGAVIGLGIAGLINVGCKLKNLDC